MLLIVNTMRFGCLLIKNCSCVNTLQIEMQEACRVPFTFGLFEMRTRLQASKNWACNGDLHLPLGLPRLITFPDID